LAAHLNQSKCKASVLRFPNEGTKDSHCNAKAGSSPYVPMAKAVSRRAPKLSENICWAVHARDRCAAYCAADDAQGV